MIPLTLAPQARGLLYRESALLTFSVRSVEAQIVTTVARGSGGVSGFELGQTRIAKLTTIRRVASVRGKGRTGDRTEQSFVDAQGNHWSG